MENLPEQEMQCLPNPIDRGAICSQYLQGKSAQSMTDFAKFTQLTSPASGRDTILPKDGHREEALPWRYRGEDFKPGSTLNPTNSVEQAWDYVNTYLGTF